MPKHGFVSGTFSQEDVTFIENWKKQHGHKQRTDALRDIFQTATRLEKEIAAIKDAHKKEIADLKANHERILRLLESSVGSQSASTRVGSKSGKKAHSENRPRDVAQLIAAVRQMGLIGSPVQVTADGRKAWVTD